MKTKRSIVKLNARVYKKESRQQRTAMLDDLVKSTHLSRKHLTMLLNNTSKVHYTPQGVKLVGDPTVTYMHKRGRKKKYTKEMVPWLKACWVLSTYRSSVHLKAFIDKNQDWILQGIAQRVIDVEYDTFCLGGNLGRFYLSEGCTQINLISYYCDKTRKNHNSQI